MKKIITLSICSLLSSYLLAQPVGLDNVGIGIANPTLARLQVNGVSGSGTTSVIFGGEGSGISFQRNLPVIGFNQYRDNTSGNGRYIANGFAATQTFDHNTGLMYFDLFPSGTANTLLPSGNRSLAINSVGNVGIRTDPTLFAALSVPKLGNFDGAAVFGGTTYNSHFYYGTEESVYIRGGNANSRVLINDNNPGSILMGGGTTLVGINTLFPTATLEIQQTGGKGLIMVDPNHSFDNWEFHVGLFEQAPESDLKVYNNGIFVSLFSSVYGYYGSVISDRRIKTNIKPLPSVLDKLQQLQPKEYEMKDFNAGHEKTFGFIAQDINKLYPDFVRINNITVDSVNHIPDMYSLNYGGFDVIAIKGLQEQYAQLKELEKKNKALLKRLDELEKQLDRR